MAYQDIVIGKAVGSFEIQRELGRGGMGVVYKAFDLSLKRTVALKILLPHLSSDPAFVKRFMREARAAAALQHPNIVTIYAVGEHYGVHFISMEYVKGRTVAALLGEMGSIPPQQAADIVRQVADALAEAHLHDIIHRDIKPKNLILDDWGRVKVMDFGLAKALTESSDITADGTTMGTPSYMSPEQCLGEEVDASTDLYSVGVTFFQMLTGRLPFTASTPLSIMRQITDKPCPSVQEINPNVPNALARIVAKLTAKNPADRYTSAEKVAADLTVWLQGSRAPAVREANQKLNEAAAFYKAGRFEESLALLREVEQSFANNPKVLHNIVVCLARLGRVTEAMEGCRRLEGQLPENKLASLRQLIETYGPDGRQQMPERKKAQQGRGGASSGMAQTAFRPLATLELGEQWPRLIETGFLQEKVDTRSILELFQSEQQVLSDDGWRAFVRLVEHLIGTCVKQRWAAAPNIPEPLLREVLEEYEGVFKEGELVVAACRAPQTFLLTDRTLYYMCHAEEVFPSAIAWRLIEAVTQMPSKAEPFMEIRLRNGQRILAHFARCEDMAAAFAEFVNEVSFIYEPEGSALVVFPFLQSEFHVPEVCCQCLSSREDMPGGFLVKDPAAPLVKMLPASDEEEERRRAMPAFRQRVGRALRRVLSEGECEEPAEVYASSDPGVEFKRCPFCSMEEPVRVSRLGNRFKVFVFNNKDYAALFAQKNMRGQA